MEPFSWSLKTHGFSMINSQPWAKTSNFEALAVYFEIILKRLCNSYGNILLTKNALNCLKITRRFSIFKNYFKNSLKTASVWWHRNIWLTLYVLTTIESFQMSYFNKFYLKGIRYTRSQTHSFPNLFNKIGLFLTLTFANSDAPLAFKVATL